MKVQFLTMPGCHNCAEAKAILDQLKPEIPDMEVEEIAMSNAKGQELVQKHSIMASPGIIVDGELFSTGGVDKKKLEEKLKS